MTVTYRGFLDFNQPSASRLAAMAAQEAWEAAAKAGEPIVTLKQAVVEQDEVSGQLISGERGIAVYADRETVGETTLFNPPTDAERLATVRSRQHAAVLAERDRRQAAGLDIYGVGRVDVSDRGLLYLAGLSQAAGDAMMADQPFSATINLHTAGSATLDGPKTKAAALVALAYINALFGHARDLDAMIEAAVTAEDAASISVLDNWPPDQPRDPATGQFVASTDA